MSIQKIIRLDNQPYAMIPNSAIRNPEITTNAFRLLAYLMSHKDGYELTYEQIERQTTLGRWAINQAAANLTSLGYLELKRPKLDNGHFGPKHWILLDPETTSTTVDHSTMEQPHLGQSTDNKENYLFKKTKNKEIYPQSEFEEFWKLYPRKVEKIDALKAFGKVWAVYGEVILEGVRRLAADPNLPPKNFIPYPASWLNAGGWTNEPYPERVKTVEELAAERRAKNELDRLAALRATESMMQEFADAAKNKAKEIPKCVHGNNVASCLRCLNKKS